MGSGRHHAFRYQAVSFNTPVVSSMPNCDDTAGQPNGVVSPR